MQDVILCSVENEIDRYAQLLKSEYNIIRVPAGNTFGDEYKSAKFILSSYKAILYRIDNRITSTLNLPVIVIVSENDMYDYDDPIGKLLFYGITEPIAEPVSDRIFMLRIHNTLKRYAGVEKVRLNYSYKMYKMERFISRMEYWLSSCKNESFEILCIDIERIKILNEIYGAAKIDDLICFIEQKIINMTETKQAITGRFDADLLIFINSKESEFIFSLQHLLDIWIKEYKFPDKISFNIGAYIVENPSMPAMKIIDRAKIAANSIKTDSSSKIAFYGKNIYSRILEEQIYISEIERAFENKEFVLYTQPQVDMTSEKIVGAEVLIRWDHPKKGLLSPADFIPAMERTGYIRRIDLYILEETCRYIRELLDRGLNPPPFSVNFSGLSFYYENLYEKICGITEKYDIPKKLIQIEITESTYTDGIQNLRATFTKLKDSGYTIIMDDFGSGYSSLNSLKSYNIDIIKLDMNFLKNWSAPDSKNKSRIILQAVLQMMDKLKLAVIAEGVEAKNQISFLTNASCRYAQGFYYYKPMPAQQFAEKIANGAVEIDTNGIYRNSGNIDGKEIIKETNFAAASMEIQDGSLIISRCNYAFTKLTKIDPHKHSAGRPELLSYIAESSKDSLLNACKAVMEQKSGVENVSVTLLENGKPFRTIRFYIFLLETGGSSNTLVCIADPYTAETELSLLSVSRILGHTIDVITEITLPSFTYRQLALRKKEYYGVNKSGNYESAYTRMIQNEIEPEDIPKLNAVFSIDNLKKFNENPALGDTVSVKYRLKNTPEVTWMESSAIFIRDSVPQKIIVLAKNVTSEVEYKKVSELAAHDYLTNAMNRSAMPKIENSLRAEKYSNSEHAVCMIDVDNFKNINDSYGHYEGDKWLKEISRIISAQCSEKDSIVRFGGDEFLVYLADIPSEKYAAEWADSVLKKIKSINDSGAEISVSIGIAFSLPPHDRFDEAYRNADKALYKVKKKRRKGSAYVYREK
ncbi:GGDEF domain-containing protein [Ruminococcus sp. Marseille-P6503]|uniref:GGDEF domain-containing protein n=1 Tax=Ruminococcus sp. Marseille-P6503 TaxID=2364796 RepID=UPI000F51F0D6|nr:GGDEF domain-containing protein [Ruminococcus sp. Marseille-P6503]